MRCCWEEYRSLNYPNMPYKCRSLLRSYAPRVYPAMFMENITMDGFREWVAAAFACAPEATSHLYPSKS